LGIAHSCEAAGGLGNQSPMSSIPTERWEIARQRLRDFLVNVPNDTSHRDRWIRQHAFDLGCVMLDLYHEDRSEDLLEWAISHLIEIIHTVEHNEVPP
jgi:hypothetical protein